MINIKLNEFFAILVIAFSSVTGACSQRAYDVAALHRGLPGKPASLDPQNSADYASSEILRDLFEGLTAETTVGSVELAVAEKLAISDDGRRYTFVIRHGAKWSDGSPVVADDFVEALRRAVAPQTAAPAANLLDCVQNASDIIAGKRPPEDLGVRAIDARTLVIELGHPAPYFLALLAYPIAFPLHRESFARHGNRFTLPGNLVSNGAYILEAQLPGGAVRLVRNPHYWDQAHVSIPAVEFLPFEDAKAELTRYRAGQLDVTSVVPASDMDWVRARLADELQTGAELGVYYLAVNLAVPELRDHPELREALALAIDRDLIVNQALKAGQTAATSFVPPGIPGYEPSRYTWASDPITARVERARALYARAGFGPDHPLHLRMVYAQGETVRYMALAVVAQWRELLGVDVELEAMEFRAFLAARNDRKAWDVLINGWNADYPDPGNFLDVFRSGSPQNDPMLADPQLDGLLTRAAYEADLAQRAALYGQAEQRLLQSYAAIPVYFVASRRLVKPYVVGAKLNPMNHNHTKDWRIDASKKAASPG